MVSAYFVMVGLGDVGSVKGDVEAGRKASSQFSMSSVGHNREIHPY